jgi:5'-3' exonuclease
VLMHITPIQDHEYAAVLVDFSWLMKRSFHGLQVQNPHVMGESEGEVIYTGDIYGTLDTLIRIRRLSPDATIILCVDSRNSDGTYTNKMVTAGYKADRQKDEAFQKYSETLACACMMSKVFRARISGVEADEIMVTLALHLGEKGMKVLIYSRDKDMNQAVTQNIQKTHQIKNGCYHEVLTPQKIQEIYMCPPEGLRMWQAIKGDGIDNVEGYPQFFKKVASVIASKFFTPGAFASRVPGDLDVKTEKQAKKLDAWIDETTGVSRLAQNFEMVRMNTLDVQAIQLDIPAARPEILEKYRLKEFKMFLGIDNQPSFASESF